MMIAGSRGGRSRTRTRRAIGRCLLPALLLGAGLPGEAVAQERPGVPGFAFGGRLLVAASDADMPASAYIDGRLGPPAGPDTLSVIRLDRPPGELRPATVPVPNSVVGPPSSVAVTPDGRRAIVIETRGGRPGGGGGATMGDLGPGGAVTVVDLGDPDHPRLVQQLRGYERARSVSVGAGGEMAAVAFAPPYGPGRPPLAIFRLADGRLAAPPSTPDVPGLAADDALVSAEFHPREGVLALVLGPPRPRLSLARVTAAGDGGAGLAAWGAPVALDRSPFLARFTPDGRFVLVNDMYLDSEARGTVSSVRIAAGEAPGGGPRHALVGHARTGVMPEGLAVSPDGRWVVTTNLERSAFPPADPRQGFFSSLTLIGMDPGTGALSTVRDFPFAGILPEAAVFDDSGRYLAVASFGLFDTAAPVGSIDFWRLAGDYADPGRLELVRTNYSVPVARGPHSMAIVR